MSVWPWKLGIALNAGTATLQGGRMQGRAALGLCPISSLQTGAGNLA